MTADELQRIALRLANSGWCRYWLNYGDRQAQVVMAIQVRCLDGATVEIPDAEGRGFKRQFDDKYTIARTNSDGTPYISKLF